MLIEFKVANFLCFRDEVTLDLQPGGRDNKLLGNIWEGHRYRVLKSVALFGPNASGKTSLLDALQVFAAFVENSATRMNIGDSVPGVKPFKLSNATRKNPSVFEVLVELGGVGFRYRIEVTRARVLRETLERQDAAKGAIWLKLIDRDAEAGRCELHERLGSEGRRKGIIEDTRDNALILSRAAERNVDSIAPLYAWFSQRVRHMQAGSGRSQPDAPYLRSMAERISGNPELLARLTAFMRDADTGIVRVAVEEDPLGATGIGVDEPDDMSTTFDARRKAFGVHRALAARETLERPEDSGYGEIAPVTRIFTEHAAAGDEVVRFNLSDESRGTLRYLLLVAALLQHCSRNGVLAVDELDAGLHPHLVRRAVQLAHSPQFGSAGAQLIFTTHDATLLDPALFRRDQIVLMQKGADGAAEPYSLWDFEKMPRNSAAWARNYLAGRFGGVPVFGPTLADIPQGEEPTKVIPATSGGTAQG